MHRALLVTALPLALSLACGGGSQTAATPPATPATGLTYTDPTGPGWRLVRDATSTPTRLILSLVGPTGLKTRGAAFNLKVPDAVKVGGFAESAWPVKDTGVFELFNTDPLGDGSIPAGQDPLEPRLLGGGVKPGNILTIGVFQKDRRATAKESGRALFQIALEFNPGAKLASGDGLPLAILKARHMPEDIGGFAVSPNAEMARKAVMVDMPVAVGTLRAQ